MEFHFFVKRLVTQGSLVAGLLVVGVLVGISDAEARTIAAKRECSICHIMWLDDFQRTDVTPLIPYDPKPVMNTGKQDVVSNERNCFSCHDGYVLDSRFVWQNNKYSHPVGVEPSDKVTLPTANEAELRPDLNLFPLNDDGKVYCGTCHSAHGVDWKQQDSPVFLRAKNIESSICLNCHRNRSTGPNGGNHPVRKKLDPIPPGLLDKGAKFGKGNIIICQSCHRIHGGRDNKVLVASNKNSALCGKCHSDRYAKDRSEASHMGTHPVNITSKKVKIPQEIIDRGGKLGGLGEIICQTCHLPHLAEKNASILVKKNNSDSALCRTCHVKEGRINNTKHDLALEDGDTKNILDQTVAKAGVCSACHVPHKGNGPRMWARQVKTGLEVVSELCLSCHSDGNIAEHKQVGSISHPLGRDLSLLGQPVKLPGFTKDGMKKVGNKQGKVSCASCHNPHQWNPDDPEQSSKPGGPSDASNRFLRVNNKGSDALCLACHKDKGNIAGTKHDVATMDTQSGGAGAVANGAPGLCKTCHLVHKGKGPRLWAIKPIDGTDPISSICMSCHNKNGLGKNKTVGEHTHPVAVPIANLGITASPDGWVIGTKKKPHKAFKKQKLTVLPLFDKRGKKNTTKKGQVTCATCHDPHRWSATTSLKGAALTGEGDATTSFLRISNSQKAELCANCHFDKEPIVLSKHNLAITAPNEKNSSGQIAKNMPVCFNCHVPHNSQGANLWARKLGPGGDKVESMCRDCHQDGGIAQVKQTGEISHPLQVDIKNAGGSTTLPLFNKQGERSKPLRGGRVTCPSCHNPHQWDPMDPTSQTGADAEIEGGASNSFLRLPAAPAGDLCTDCHHDQRWIKGTDHDLRVTAPEAKNLRGQTVQESGVCQQCHTVHNAEQALRLWGREPGDGQDPNARMCLGCHGEGLLGEEKIPVKKNHPAQVTAQILQRRTRRGQVRGFTPLFDPEGRAANTGVISCPTCHNPHRWSPVVMEFGTGENEEGNSRTSFLRNRSKLALCANCHGMDALFRYKYFHGESSRKKHAISR
ncbi:hypothetical protein MNBD_GAMMA26-1788 [hydrothermal vent metagenome]|uniref:Uncharacterized protein n=1 Tax=hydrothermal vent metagenome TaxID=652676 RepID=A0A3B1BX22_9ZZZZ